MNLSTEQLQMGALIDAKMQRLLREGHDEVSIIGEMFDCRSSRCCWTHDRTLWMSCAGALPDSIIMQRSLKHWQLASSQGRFKCPSKSVTIFHVNSGRSQLSCSASAGLLKEFALPLSIFVSKDVRAFTILTEFMNKRPPAKKPQAKIQTVKKQIPVKKIAPDRIEELVKKHLGNIGEAENAFKSVSALLEKHKTKYPELEQYIEHVSTSDRSIQILEDIKDPRRAHHIFKILLTGVEPAYQVAHPGEKDHTNVDRAASISTFEEALAKAIVQIVLSRQAEQASQTVGSPKE